MNRVFVHLVSLPMAVKGVTIPEDESGDYIVFVNEALSPDARKRVVNHEFEHIKKCHFCDTLTVVEAERDAG